MAGDWWLVGSGSEQFSTSMRLVDLVIMVDPVIVSYEQSFS